MKKTMVLLAGVTLLMASAVWAEPQITADKSPPQKSKGECPKTKVIGDVGDCLRCHVAPNFALKEANPEDLCAYPNHNTRIRNGEGLFNISGGITGGETFQMIEAMEYFRRKDVKSVVIDIHSPGGSLFEGQKMCTLMQEWERTRGTVTTRVHGFAASAAFQIWTCGTINHRLAGRDAELMWHELMSFKLFDISTPSDKKDEADVLRHLQDTRNAWLASRSKGKLTKEEIDKKIAKKEFWMNGAQAMDYGFCDGFLD